VFNLSLYIFLATLLAAIFGFLADSGKRPRFWRTLTFVCSAISLVLAFALKHVEDAQQLEREEERKKHQEELRSKADELAKKNDEIAKLTRENAAILTEGDSYVFFAFLLGDGSFNNPQGVLMHVGKYPVYDVVLYITDYDKWKSLFPLASGEKFIPGSEEDFKKAQKLEAETKTQVEVGTIPPGEGTRIGGWKLPDRDKITYSIRIKSRFQTFNQHLKLQRVNGRWKQAYRVIKHDANKKLVVLKEEVPKDFPRDPKDGRFWDFR
jgi:hypothetical protein